MSSFTKRLSDRLISSLCSEKKLRQSFRSITGRNPINLAIYKQAMMHSSMAEVNNQGIKESYERLEYLGDAVLGMIVAEYLYSRYPFREEGFLTDIRSKIVSRESLNDLSYKIGLTELVQYNYQNRTGTSIYGDAMEALVGAVYLDLGFKFCKRFVIKRLIKPHYDLNTLITTITNHKSKLLEWSQKENVDLRFGILGEEDKKFTAQVFLNDAPKAKGYGFSKKKAEQDAARKTYERLNLVK